MEVECKKVCIDVFTVYHNMLLCTYIRNLCTQRKWAGLATSFSKSDSQSSSLQFLFIHIYKA